MRPIEKTFSNLPIVLNDFFKHSHKQSPLRVFLCGSKPTDLQYDLRTQVRCLLEKNMGCKTFFGEEIEDFKNPKVDLDHLTIEVTQAKKSDLILMFLGSPGTMAEVTAFAMNKQVSEKTVVFNNKKYHKVKSFINQGPLKLLPKENVIPYDAESNEPTLELVKHLDLILAKTWYKRILTQMVLLTMLPLKNLSFEEFICLALIYSTFPVRYKALNDYYPDGEASLKKSLKFLFVEQFIKKDEEKYIPRKILGVSDYKISFLNEYIDDISKVRLHLLESRLKDGDIVSDYRLIV